jgi:hypothetical protein
MTSYHASASTASSTPAQLLPFWRRCQPPVSCTAVHVSLQLAGHMPCMAHDLTSRVQGATALSTTVVTASMPEDGHDARTVCDSGQAELLCGQQQ